MFLNIIFLWFEDKIPEMETHFYNQCLKKMQLSLPVHVSIKWKHQTFRTGVSGLEDNFKDNSGALLPPTRKQNIYGGGVKEMD